MKTTVGVICTGFQSWREGYWDSFVSFFGENGSKFYLPLVLQDSIATVKCNICHGIFKSRGYVTSDLVNTKLKAGNVTAGWVTTGSKV
jgi:hypothetical protein